VKNGGLHYGANTHWGAFVAIAVEHKDPLHGVSKAGFLLLDFDAISAACCGVTLAAGH
jgi:hypothetical protein